MSNKISRVVGVSGYSDPEDAIVPVLEAMAEKYNIEDFEPFSFSYGMKNPEEIAKAAERSLFTGHSAAALLMNKTVKAHAFVTFNAPEPTPKVELIHRAALKTQNYAKQLRSPDEHQREFAAQRLKDGTRELGRHPLRNLSKLGEISRFSGLDRLSHIKIALPDVAVRAVVSSNDELFPLPPAWKVQKAKDNGVEPVFIDGTHDELYRDPVGVVADSLDGLRIG